MLHLHLKYIKCLKCMCVRSAGAYMHCMCRLCMSRFLQGVMEQQKPKERETGRRTEEDERKREEGGMRPCMVREGRRELNS